MRAMFMAAAAFACLALGSCGALQKLNDFTISQSTVDGAMSAYDSAFLAPAKAYRGLYDSNPCRGSDTFKNAAGLCAQRSIVVKLQQADKVVEDALTQVQSQLDICKANGQATCTGISAVYSTFKTAIGAAEAIAIPSGAN